MRISQRRKSGGTEGGRARNDMMSVTGKEKIARAEKEDKYRRYHGARV